MDIASLTSKGDWSSKAKRALEAEIIKVSAPPLCLDPNPIHGEIAITAQHTSQIFNIRSIKRKARKYSQVCLLTNCQTYNLFYFIIMIFFYNYFRLV